MNVLIALLPAIGWGLIPLIVNRVPHSQAVNQILGVGLGATLVGIIVTLIQRPAMELGVSILALISGALWSVGQVGQSFSYTRIGISKTMPLSTGLQLVGNTIIGVLIFGDWKTSSQYVIGIFALILIVIGVTLKAVTGKDASKKVSVKDLGLLLSTTAGYWVYSAFPNAVSANAQALFLPQMMGILLGATLYLLFTKRISAYTEKASWLDMFAGIAFGVGAYAYIFSAQMNGITLAFIYSQLSVIISTVGSMVLLSERKYGQELISTLVGLLLIVVGAAL